MKIKKTYLTCEISSECMFTNVVEMSLNEVLTRILNSEWSYQRNILGVDFVWVNPNKLNFMPKIFTYYKGMIEDKNQHKNQLEYELMKRSLFIKTDIQGFTCTGA